MTDESDIQLVQDLLIAAGLTAERIPECNTKRCDFRAWDRNEQYLIEVKGVHDDDQINAKLGNGEVHEATRFHVHSKTAEEAIRKSMKQFRETEIALNLDDPLRIVAILVQSTFGPDLSTEQVVGTLYGTRYITDLGSAHGLGRECLYFSESEFFRHRAGLDAAIVVDANGVMMLLNDHCRRIDQVRQSVLGRFFAERDALNAADSLERTGDFFVADCSIDRRDEKAVLDYVAGKYNLQRPIECTPTEYSAMSSVARTNGN